MELITDNFLIAHGFTYQGKWPYWYHSETIGKTEEDEYYEEEDIHFCIWAENDNEWYFYVAGIKVGKPLQYQEDLLVLFKLITGKYLIKKP